MERILPIRRQAVDDQAAAVQAAEDVLAAAADDRQNGRGGRRDLDRCQRRVVAAAAGVHPHRVRLQSQHRRIRLGRGRPHHQSASPHRHADRSRATGRHAGRPDGTIRGRYSRPGPPSRLPARRATVAESADLGPAAAKRRADPCSAARQLEERRSRRLLRRGKAPERERADLAPPREPFGGDAEQPAESRRWCRSSRPVRSAVPERPTSRRWRPPAASLYPALVDAAPAVQAKQLTIALNWDRSLPEGTGKPLSLADCLLGATGGDRRATIEAYWLMRQRAAEYQAILQESEMLEALMPVVLERRLQPAGATDMLRLRSAQTAAQAAARQTLAALVEAQYALAVRLGTTAEAAWPLASTVPHSGRYLLRLDAQPRGLAESWPVRRLAATIPGLSENVQQQAAAVVEADAARVAAAEKYRAGRSSFDQVIGGRRPADAANPGVSGHPDRLQPGDCRVRVDGPPAATPADKLVAALVVKP